MRPTLLDAKHVRERVILRFPFASEVPPGITIASVIPVVSMKAGVDPNPAAVLLGAPQIVATTLDVLQRVQGGLASAKYGILMEATLSDGTVLVRAVELPVIDF